MQSTRNSTRRAASHPCLTLLPAGVTRPPTLLRTPVVSYTTFSPFPPPRPSPARGGGCRVGDVCFLWPYPADCSAPRFPRRRALGSADFPRLFTEVQSRDRPTNLRRIHHTFPLLRRQFPYKTAIRSPLTFYAPAAKMILCGDFYTPFDRGLAR